MQPFQNCIAPNVCIGREILCLPYAGFLIVAIHKLLENIFTQKKIQEVFFEKK